MGIQRDPQSRMTRKMTVSEYELKQASAETLVPFIVEKQ